jgi:hypothetical protein
MYKGGVERVVGVQESKEERMSRVNGRVERFCTKVSCKKWTTEEERRGEKKENVRVEGALQILCSQVLVQFDLKRKGEKCCVQDA